MCRQLWRVMRILIGVMLSLGSASDCRQQASLTIDLAAGSPSGGAQAEAFLLLSQLSAPAEGPVSARQGTEATGRTSVPSGAQSAASDGGLPRKEELLQRATSVAPQHSASAAHAWRLYGDWLYTQHDMVDEHETGSGTAALPMRVKAAKAYCQTVSHAAGSASAGDTMSALLRVLQASVPMLLRYQGLGRVL